MGGVANAPSVVSMHANSSTKSDMTDKSPQQIYLLKQWSDYNGGYSILRAYRDRMDAELFIERQIESMCKLATEDPDEFESETGYSKEFFGFFEEDENAMNVIINQLRNLFHIEKVELY
jgi:hypothetical protein